MIGAKSLSGQIIRASGAILAAQQAEDMTAPETFATASKQPLTTGRRPDRTGYALRDIAVYAGPVARRSGIAITDLLESAMFDEFMKRSPNCARSLRTSSRWSRPRPVRASWAQAARLRVIWYREFISCICKRSKQRSPERRRRIARGDADGRGVQVGAGGIARAAGVTPLDPRAISS